MAIGYDDFSKATVYTGSVGATKVAVTTNTQVLVYTINIVNNTAALAYMQIFDLADASVTVGTTAPSYVIPVQLSGVTSIKFKKPLGLLLGFDIACTTTRTGNTGATCDVVISYNSAP